MQPLPLSEKLKQETKPYHDGMHKNALLLQFLSSDGSIPDDQTYREYLEYMYAVYSTMEKKIVDYQEHPEISPFFQLCFMQLLFRSNKIRMDISFIADDLLFEENKHQSEELVKKISVSNPGKLIGHMYTRYMGDLSGGQFFKRALDRKGRQKSTSMFSFEEVDRPIDKVKSEFKQVLDELPGDIHSDVIQGAIDNFVGTKQICDKIISSNNQSKKEDNKSNLNANKFVAFGLVIVAAVASTATVVYKFKK